MFSKILVPLDRSALAEQAIGQAAAIARASAASLDLVLVHEPFAFDGYMDAPWNSNEWSAEHKYVETVANELAASASIPVTHSVMRGSPAEMIVQRVQDAGIDLIVMTSHGRTGLSRAWMGSVAHAIVRHSTVPVLMLRPSEPPEPPETPVPRTAAGRLFRHILVPIDGSALSSSILDAAASLAKASGASLTLLEIVQPIPVINPYDDGSSFSYATAITDDVATQALVDRRSTEVGEMTDRLRSEEALTIDARVEVAAHVARAIVEFARAHDVDAIAMSTHGRGASRVLLGSVTDKVLRSSHVPMLLKRPALVTGAYLQHSVSP